MILVFFYLLTQFVCKESVVESCNSVWKSVQWPMSQPAKVDQFTQKQNSTCRYHAVSYLACVYKIQGDIVISAIVMVMNEEIGMAKITYESNIPPSHIQNIIFTKIWPMDDFGGFGLGSNPYPPRSAYASAAEHKVRSNIQICFVQAIPLSVRNIYHYLCYCCYRWHCHCYCYCYLFLWVTIINTFILLPSPCANILELVNQKGNLIKFALKLGTLCCNASSIYLRIYSKRRCVHSIRHSHNGGCHQSLSWKHTSR